MSDTVRDEVEHVTDACAYNCTAADVLVALERAAEEQPHDPAEGGVPLPVVAAYLPLTESTTGKYLRLLADRDEAVRVDGLHPTKHRPRPSWLPADADKLESSYDR